MDWCTLIVFCSTLAVANGLPKLLFANRYNICSVDVGPGYRNSTLVIAGLEDAAALDYIHADQMIYWTDVSQERIKSARLNGSLSSADVVSTGIVSPDGLACDWITRKLYWVDSETNRVEASNVDGSMRRVLFWQELDQPRAIALDPLRGYFYWTDWGETAKIERAAMDGLPSSREVIVSSDIFWPNGLTIDYDEARLYWTDARLHYVHSANLDGSERRAVVPDLLPHPFAVSVYRGAIYWTDWQMRAVFTCDKSDPGNVRMVTDKLYSPMDIHVFDARRQPQGNNPCGKDNGGCSHLCFLSPWLPFYSCQCPTGIRLLADNRTCDNGPREMLLLARRTDLRLISLDTYDYTDVVLDIPDVRHAIAIDYDPVEKMIYWTDDDLHVIRRAFLNGSGIQTVVDVEVHSPDGIAVDWLSRNLFWTDTGSDLIQVSRLNGTSRKVIIADGLDEPRAIVVDPVRGQMYWSDWGKDSKIEKSYMDGTGRLVLVNVSLGWPNGLAIDRRENRLYWADAKLDRIEYVGTDGSGRKTLVSENIPHIFGFTLLGDFVYWTDWQSRAVERVNKTSGRQRSMIIDQLPDIMGLTAVTTTVTTAEDIGCSVANGGCSHLCFNHPSPPSSVTSSSTSSPPSVVVGDIVCACPFGMELEKSDQKTCVLPEALVIYAKRTEIHVVSLENVENDVVVPLHDLESVTNIDYDFANNQIYWADSGKRVISRAYLNGSVVQSLIRYGLESPDQVAVDWLAQNLYWIDSGTERIEMSRLDGTSRRVLLWKDVKPRAFALDPINGFFFWCNAVGRPTLERAALDGAQRHTIVTLVEQVNSLIVDYSEKMLYWVNVDGDRIESSTYDGAKRRDVIRIPVLGRRQPFGLTLHGDDVYWTDWQRGNVQRANKVNGMDQQVVVGGINSLVDVAVFHLSRQTSSNECSLRNGGCSHLCISGIKKTDGEKASSSSSSSLLSSHHCICSNYFSLSSNNQTCSPPDSMVFISQKNSIHQMSIGSDALDSPDVSLALPPQHMRIIKAFRYNSVDDHIYWIESKTKSIRKIKTDGSNMVVLLESVGHHGGSSPPFHGSSSPYDIVVDENEGLVFWSDSGRNTISVMRTDGTEIGTIVNDTQRRPRALVLVSEMSFLFWTNVAISSQGVVRSSVDGSTTETVVTGDFGVLGPIAADGQTKRLFWADLERRRIESAYFDGSDRRVLVTDVAQAIALDVLAGHLYWADRETKSLERVDRDNGRDRTVLRSKLALLSGFAIVRRRPTTTKTYRNACAQRNLRCSHLCVRREDGNGARCACPLGLALDGATGCVASQPCADNQLTCSSGSGSGACVPLGWRCDGELDCRDGSDEADCSACPAGEFRCQDGQCIASSAQCNGRKECRDGSDEALCTACRESASSSCVGDRTCYARAQLCDGVVDCWDGFDEMNCAATTGARHGTGAQYTGVVVGVVCGLVTIAVIFGVIYLCRRKTRHCFKVYNKSSLIVVTQNVGSPSDLKCAQLCSIAASVRSGGQSQRSRQQRGEGGDDGPASDIGLAGACGGGDLVVDTFTLTSFVSHYPHETLNPPPTPITSDVSSAVDCPSSDGASASRTTTSKRRCQKRYRLTPVVVRPTTPCSTDVCDDSESYVTDERHRFLSSVVADAGCCFEHDLLLYPPPPPTPCSEFFSDGGGGCSCPPSPRASNLCSLLSVVGSTANVTKESGVI